MLIVTCDVSAVSPWNPLCSQRGRLCSKCAVSKCIMTFLNSMHRADDILVYWSAATEPGGIKWRLRHLVNAVITFYSSYAVFSLGEFIIAL